MKNCSTLSASDGSVPAIAPARAAVKDSTSSAAIVNSRRFCKRAHEHTNQDNHKGFLIFDHLHDAAEQFLDELPGLGKPTREQRMRIDLKQSRVRVSVKLSTCRQRSHLYAAAHLCESRIDSF